MGDADMRKLTTVGIVLGLLIGTATPIQAAHSGKYAKRYPRHAHVAMPVPPMLVAAAKQTNSNRPKLCTYMGGPKSSLWSCR
jgi:hypothetical protein